MCVWQLWEIISCPSYNHGNKHTGTKHLLYQNLSCWYVLQKKIPLIFCLKKDLNGRCGASAAVTTLHSYWACNIQTVMTSQNLCTNTRIRKKNPKKWKRIHSKQKTKPTVSTRHKEILNIVSILLHTIRWKN